MGNFFDQFDASSADKSSKPTGNFFDQFDASSSGQKGPPTETVQQKTEKLHPVEKGLRGLIYGLTGAAKGDIKTARHTGYFNEGALNALDDLVGGIQNIGGASPDQYDPAGRTFSDSSKSVGERLQYAPRAMAEGLGGLSQDIAAGSVGGAPAFLASNALRHTGETIERVRETDKTNPNAELTSEQKFRVGGAVVANALLDKFGTSVATAAPKITGAGILDTAAQVAKAAPKAIMTEAGVNAGGGALDKAIVERQAPTLGDLAVNSITGAATGAAGQAARGLRETTVSGRIRSLNNLDPQSRGEVADILGRYKGDFESTQKHIDKDLVQAKKGLDDETKNTIAEAQIAIQNGQRVSKDIIDIVNEADPQAARALRNLDTLSAMRELDNGGVQNTSLGRILNPFQKGQANTPESWGGKILDYRAIRALAPQLIAHGTAASINPIAGAALLGGQIAGAKALKGIDRFTGAEDVGNVIANRFGGTAEPAPTIAAARAQAKALEIQKNEFRKLADLHNANLEKTEALNDKQSLDSQEQLRAIADRRAKAESSAAWKTAVESLNARRNSDQIKAKDLETRVSSFQDKAIGSLDRLDKTVASEQLAEQKANQLADRNYWKQQRERLAIRDKSDIPASEYLGQDLGVNQNVPLPELVSSDTRLALKTAKLNKYLQDQRMSQLGKQAQIMRNSQSVEEARQNALLQDVPRQLSLRENSESGSASPTALALSVAKLHKNAMENAEPQGPTAPPTSTPVSARPDLVKTNMRLERIKKEAEAKAQKEQQAAEKVQAKAKADKRVKEATKKVEQAKEDVETPGTIIRHRGQQIVVPEGSGVRKIKNYRQSFIEKTDRRMDVIDAAKKLTKDPKVHERLDQLAQDWTDTTDNSQAHRVVVNLINDVVNDISTPKNIAAYLKNNTTKVKNTWKNLDPIQKQESSDD